MSLVQNPGLRWRLLLVAIAMGTAFVAISLASAGDSADPPDIQWEYDVLCFAPDKRLYKECVTEVGVEHVFACSGYEDAKIQENHNREPWGCFLEFLNEMGNKGWRVVGDRRLDFETGPGGVGYLYAFERSLSPTSGGGG